MSANPVPEYTSAMRRSRLSREETPSYKVAQIHAIARMRFGAVCGLLIIVVAQALSASHGETFEALVRDITPALLVGAAAFTGILMIAKRDVRQLRRAEGRSHLRTRPILR